MNWLAAAGGATVFCLDWNRCLRAVHSNGFHWILIVVFCFHFLSPSRRDCVVFFGGGGS